MSNENVWPKKNFFQFHKSINNNFSFLCAMNTTTTKKIGQMFVCLFWNMEKKQHSQAQNSANQSKSKTNE